MERRNQSYAGWFAAGAAMINAMRQAGIDPPETLIDDGKLHRYAGAADKPQNKKNWYILYPMENGMQAGSFGRWVGDSNGAVKWCNRTAAEFTDEEKREYRKRQDDMRRKQADDRKQAADECSEKCRSIWAAAQPASDQHPYLVKKQVRPFGLKQSGDRLLIPIMTLKGELRGLQFISPDGSKVFKTGTDYAGALHMIGKPVDNTLIITEGYATGASIHMATGHAVLVAFVAGNLKAVAESARAKQPSWDIIIAADNDQWAKEYDAAGNVTAWHTIPCYLNGGKRINTGKIKAIEAAKAAKAAAIIPFFKDESTHPTDFNDLHILEGLEEVKRQIFPPPIADYVPPEEYEGPELNSEGEPEYREHPLQSAPFIILGYDRSDYFFMAHGTGQVTALTPSNITKPNLLALAPLQWWQEHFPGNKTNFDEDAAKNNLIQTCQGRGIYNSDRVRGLGAWEDEGRSVLHLGDVLIVDGQRFDPSWFKSGYIYERAISIADEKTPPLQNADSNKLIELCDMLSWEKPINGRLLAGWCVASIICGALKWRPHIWLTGPSGAGKSWVIHNIIKHISGQHLKGMLGSTTEAGLRNALRNDAFSVFFDEFEAEDKSAAARIQAILEFARPASSNEDSRIYKAKSGGGGVNSYQPRSCIGVASINVNMTQKADISRVSVLSLINGKQETFKNEILPFWAEYVRPPEFARGIRSRSISLISIINKNADTFQEAATIEFNSRRSGDQYGTLLACAYSLCSSKLVTLEQAKEFVGRQDWSAHTITDDQGDEKQCLAAILESLINMGGGATMSVAELLADCHNLVDSKAQKDTLERHGIKYILGGFVVHNKHSAVKRMLERTPWGGNWSRIIERLPGAQKQSTHRFCGVVAKGTMLPIKFVLEEE